MKAAKNTRMKSKIPLYSSYALGFIGDYNLALIGMVSVLYATILGGNTVQVGWIGTAYGLSYSFMPAILGALTDMIPRKKSLIISTALQIFFASFFIYTLQMKSMARFFPAAIFTLVGFGISYSFYWPNVEAFISEYTQHEEKSHERAISNFCIWWGTGSAFGSWSGGFLVELNVRLASYITISLFFISLLLSIFVLPVSSRHPEIKALREREKNELNNEVRENNPPLKRNVHKVVFLIILFSNLIFAFLSRLTTSYFANFAKLPEGLNYSGRIIGNLTLIFGTLRVIYFYAGRFLSKNLSSLIQSTILSGALVLPLYFLSNILAIIAILFFLGFLNGRLYYISLMLLMREEQEKKSTKAGLFEAMVGLGSSSSPILAGALALVSLRFPFLIYSFFVMSLGFIQYAIQIKYLKQRTNKQ